MNTINNALAQNAETQKNITPKMAIELLKDGNKRFLNSTPINRIYLDQVKTTSKGQYPFAVVLSCIDSRVPTEIIFDQGIGDIFNACVAGNFVNEDILGSMEFACKLVGVKLIVVLGHTACGAVKGACDSAELGNLTQLLNKIKPAVEETESVGNKDRSSKNIDFVNKVAEKNVDFAAHDILEQSAVLRQMHSDNEIEIATAMYDVETGKVTFLNN
jgi:carbonic anhydrase